MNKSIIFILLLLFGVTDSLKGEDFRASVLNGVIKLSEPPMQNGNDKCNLTLLSDARPNAGAIVVRMSIKKDIINLEYIKIDQGVFRIDDEFINNIFNDSSKKWIFKKIQRKQFSKELDLLKHAALGSSRLGAQLDGVFYGIRYIDEMNNYALIFFDDGHVHQGGLYRIVSKILKLTSK